MSEAKKDLSRRGFLANAGKGLAAVQAIGAVAATRAAAQQVPEPPGRKLGWAIVGLGSLAINQILPAFARCEKSRVTALVSGHPDKARKLAARYGVAEKNIYDYQGYDTIARQPRGRRRLRRAAEQHARRVHDPRAQGGQARAVREADGEHPRGVPGDDRRRARRGAQADGRLPLPLRAVQPGDDPDGARAGARADQGDRGGPWLQHRRPQPVAAQARPWPAAAR